LDRSPAHANDHVAIDTLREIRQLWGIQDHWHHTHPNDRCFIYRTHNGNAWIQSRLDRIHAVRRHGQTLFKWKAGPIETPTDHWMVAVKFALKDTPDIGRGC
jgi:hypothetical protein